VTAGCAVRPTIIIPRRLIQQPVTTVAHEVLGYFQRLSPDIVMTHDPFGGYGHPDHVRVCEATTAAFYLARAQRRQR
jgi:N-acetyl-1-D-myo-inositol-2-amino-2-deoxy-alpha-D-glucopyranoside deacetylase